MNIPGHVRLWYQVNYLWHKNTSGVFLSAARVYKDKAAHSSWSLIKHLFLYQCRILVYERGHLSKTAISSCKHGLVAIIDLWNIWPCKSSTSKRNSDVLSGSYSQHHKSLRSKLHFLENKTEICQCPIWGWQLRCKLSLTCTFWSQNPPNLPCLLNPWNTSCHDTKTSFLS